MKITQKHPYMDVDYAPYKGVASPVEMRFIN